VSTWWSNREVDRAGLVPCLGAFLCVAFVVVFLLAVGLVPDHSGPLLPDVSDTVSVSQDPGIASDNDPSTSHESPEAAGSTVEVDQQQPGVAATERGTSVAPASPGSRRFQARALWGMAALAYLLSMAGVALVAGRIVLQELREHGLASNWIALTASPLAFAPLVILLIVGWTFDGLPSSFESLNEYMDQVGADRTGIEVFTSIGNWGTVLTLWLMLVAVQVVTRPIEAAGSAWIAASRKRIQGFGALLTSGSCMLSAAVLEVNALFRWPTTVIEAAQVPSATVVAHTMTLLAGGSFTLYVLAVFLPGAWLLRQRVAREAEREWPDATDEERRKHMQEQSLLLSMPGRVTASLTALAPLIVGTSMAEVLSALLQ